jgi:hypothetical protein
VTAPDRDLFGKAPRRHPNWDHRRGEPRTFALAWTIFLMLATLVMFASMSAALVVTVEIYRPATRILLTTITAGIVLLWPMVRLSQAAPSGSAAPHLARDLLIVLIPVQALIWPQSLRLLGGWPIERCAALAACQGAWAVVVGGVAALALALDPVGRRVGPARGVWMGLIAVIVIGVPLVQVGLGSIGAGATPTAAMMASPLTGAWDLMENGEALRARPVAAAAWRAIGLTAFAGAAVWVAAWTAERARRREWA